MPAKKTFKFGIRETPKGAVAWMETPSGRLQEKRFRNGYSTGKISAQKHIDSWIEVLKDVIEMDGLPECEIIETHKE